jgi:outer membrane protein assembly factor BamB
VGQGLEEVCQKLWAELPADVTIITPANIRDVHISLADFYSDAVKKAAGLGVVTERRIREWVQQNLLTHPGGTRGTVHVGAEATAGLPNEVVEVLVGTLLRAEFRAGARWLEITHDSLLGPIELSNADFFRADGPLAQEADALALAVTQHWQAEARTRRLNDPYPLPVRWTPADPSLTDAWEELERLASSGAGWAQQSQTWATGPAELAGSDAGLADVLARVPTHRLVILGEPGAGKSTLMIRLVLDLLARRLRGGPVPMLVSAASWDPQAQDLKSWLARQLAHSFPHLAAATSPGDSPRTRAEALLTSGLILPVLDGLDEIHSTARRSAFRRINQELQPGDPLIAGCRTTQYEQTVRPPDGDGVVLRAAAAVELRPLPAAAVAHYLRETAGDLASAARWDPVIASLGPQTPVGQALGTPLMTVLARTIYNPRPGERPGEQRDPAELCDPGLAGRAGVEEHLLAAFIPAAYSAGTPGRWTATQAERWLALLASYAGRSADAVSIAWWQLTQAGPRRMLGAVAGLSLASIVALVLWLALGTRWLHLSLTVAAVFGLAMAFRLAGHRRPSGELQWNAWRGLPAGLVIGVLTGIAAARVFGTEDGLKSGVAAAVAFGFTAGLEGVPGHRLTAGSPKAVLSRDRLTALVIAVVSGETIGVAIGAIFDAARGAVVGVTLGILSAATIGLASMSDESIWLQWQLTRGWLSIRSRLPWRLLTFLGEAHDRGVLRQVGSVYQFRHLQLQHLLASRSPERHPLTASKRGQQQPAEPGRLARTRPIATAVAVGVTLFVGTVGVIQSASVRVHQLAVSWTYRTPASVDGSPAVTGGVVYIADDNGTVYALSATTGHARWIYHTGSQIDSRPAVANGTVYIGNDAGKFFALSAASGVVRWVRTFAGGIDSGPAVARGIVHVADGNNYVQALDAGTGADLWRYPTGAIVNSSPLIRDGVVYVGGEDSIIYALNARTGQLIWATSTSGAVGSSPAIADGILYVGDDDYDIYALNAANGKIIWTRKTGGPVNSSPAVAYGTVYIGSNDGKIYALNAANGTIKWTRKTGGPVYSSPAVAYGIVYIGSNDGKIYALRAANGTIKWTRKTGGDVFSSPVVIHGMVYVGSDNDEILALKAATGF